MSDSVRWMIEKLNHPNLYQPLPDWLRRELLVASSSRAEPEREAALRAIAAQEDT